MGAVTGDSRHLVMKPENPRLDCESSELITALGTISGKWKLRIICLLFDGTELFSELLRGLPGIHRGTLSYELRRLEAQRIIDRTQYPTMPPTVEYTLTVRGTALEALLVALSRWSKLPGEEPCRQPSTTR
jgi:DNA-binding HxlR family transcriptional regulator